MWLRVDRLLEGSAPAERSPAIYAEVRNGVARFHGSRSSTMMRGEAYGFYLLGTCVERADMTARILDVKYHLLLPDVVDGRLAARLLPVGGAAEVAVRLRGLPAPATRPGCGRSTSPSSSSSRATFPRSLRFSVERMRHALQRDRHRRRGAHRGGHGARSRRTCRDRRPSGCSRVGLHEYLEEFLGQHRRLQWRRVARVLRALPGRGAVSYVIDARAAADLSARRCGSTTCEVRLTPQDERRTSACARSSSTIDPARELRSYVDGFGNHVHYFSLIAPHEHLARAHARRGRDLARQSVRLRRSLPPARERAWFARAPARPAAAVGLRPASQRRDAGPRARSPRAAFAMPPRDPAAAACSTRCMAALDWIGDSDRVRARRRRTCPPLGEVLARRRRRLPGPRPSADQHRARLGLPGALRDGLPGPRRTPRKTAMRCSARTPGPRCSFPAPAGAASIRRMRLVANDTYVAVAVGRDAGDAAAASRPSSRAARRAKRPSGSACWR